MSAAGDLERLPNGVRVVAQNLRNIAAAHAERDDPVFEAILTDEGVHADIRLSELFGMIADGLNDLAASGFALLHEAAAALEDVETVLVAHCQHATPENLDLRCALLDLRIVRSRLGPVGEAS